MTKLEQKIEEKRHALYRAMAHKKITDKVVVKISQQLDELLNKQARGEEIEEPGI